MLKVEVNNIFLLLLLVKHKKTLLNNVLVSNFIICNYKHYYSFLKLFKNH